MVAAKRGYLRPVGEWNYEEVTVKGSKIKVELNGTVILDCRREHRGPRPWPTARTPARIGTSGFFGFAGHGDPVAFRSVAIKPIH